MVSRKGSGTLDAKHPIWSILRFIVGWIALYIVLKETASNFDETEQKVLTIMAITFVGGETLIQTIVRLLPSIARGILSQENPQEKK